MLWGRFLLVALLVLRLSAMARADAVDDYIEAQMKKWRVPGLSLAIIQDGRIIKAAGYGFREKGSAEPVMTDTLFQAGSISKSVAAVGALKLMEQGKIGLDDNVNRKLRSWKVPENGFTKKQKVTLRRILSHTAGLTVHGFPGYAVNGPVPSLVQILNGAKPANTEPIRVDMVPGTKWRYSGGGYTVMQQMLLDVTGTPFPAYMQKMVLSPMGMKESTYQQPLPAEWAKRTATGTYTDGSLVEGRWHIYPEMAAAGLWSTPSDLARFAIAVQEAYTGKNNRALSATLARQMLTLEKAEDGLGVFLEGKKKTLRFLHSGRDEGFDALLVAYAETGQGIAIMINSNENSGMMDRIARFVGEQYRWPDYPRPSKKVVSPVKVEEKVLFSLTGYYDVGGTILTLTASGNKLIAQTDGGLLDELLPTSETTFVGPDTDYRISFVPDAPGGIKGTLWTRKGRTVPITRFSSLISGIPPQLDTDPTRITQVQSFMEALKNKGRGIAEMTYLTAGAKKDFSNGYPPAGQVGPLTFVRLENIAERGLTRHGSKVAQLFIYSIAGGAPSRYLLVYRTANGLITDFDIVQE